MRRGKVLKGVIVNPNVFKIDKYLESRGLKPKQRKKIIYG